MTVSEKICVIPSYLTFTAEELHWAQNPFGSSKESFLNNKKLLKFAWYDQGKIQSKERQKTELVLVNGTKIYFALLQAQAREHSIEDCKNELHLNRDGWSSEMIRSSKNVLERTETEVYATMHY